MPKINLMDFLRNYYGITDSNTFFENLSYEDLMELFPYKEEGKDYLISFMKEDLENLSSGDLLFLKEILQSKNNGKCLSRKILNRGRDELK